MNKQKKINPKQINFFNYSYKGTTITFTKIGEKMFGESSFNFKVKDDSDLTDKLNQSVKATEVRFKSIPFAAEALFQIIREGEFKKLISHEEWLEMKAKFNRYFDEYLKFKIFDISDLMPNFRAAIVHPALKTTFFGQGRTKQEAKAQALKKLLDA